MGDHLGIADVVGFCKFFCFLFFINFRLFQAILNKNAFSTKTLNFWTKLTFIKEPETDPDLGIPGVVGYDHIWLNTSVLM